MAGVVFGPNLKVYNGWFFKEISSAQLQTGKVFTERNEQICGFQTNRGLKLQL